MGNKSPPVFLLYACRIFTKLTHDIVHGEVQYNHGDVPLVACATWGHACLKFVFGLHLRRSVSY